MYSCFYFFLKHDITSLPYLSVEVLQNKNLLASIGGYDLSDSFDLCHLPVSRVTKNQLT